MMARSVGDSYKRLVNVVVLVLVAGTVGIAQDTMVTNAPDHEEDPTQLPRLVWTELRISDRRARIQSLPADPSEYITSNVISSKYYYELTPAHWIAIASDYADGAAFWSDANHKRIMKGGLYEGASASGVFEGTSSTVDGIAVDWLANNVYWTDAAYNWIIVADYDITWFKIIVDDGLDKPRGVAVYPQLGYLFWTDWGSRRTIERSTLGGEDRIVIIDDNLYFPNGLTIDYTTDRLYWTDADPSGNRLEVSNLNGTNRSTVYSHQADQGHFFDVAVFQNYIFITDWYNGIRCIRKDSGEHYFALNVGGRPFGLTLHGEGLLPGTSSPCDAKPCDQLCVSDLSGYKCLCQDGFDLLEDGLTCYRTETSLAKPQILLVTQNNICYFPSNFPDLTLPDDYERNCILTNRTHVVALDVDVSRKTMFFSDFVQKTIQSVRLADSAVVEFLIGGVGSVEGIAVDWLAQNLYWTDFHLNHIGVSRYDGSNRRILLKDDILSPRSIVIHAGERIMFWTEFGTSSHLERASLDGSDRRIILNNVDGLNGLAIDFEENRLYYADRTSGSIQHMDFDGNGQTRLYTRSGAQFFDMDIHKDYLLWTEWNVFNGLHAINRENRRIVQSHSIKNESTYGVRVYSNDRQPNYDNVCIDNGGCQHLCLPISAGGMRCECRTGYQLHSDGRSCVADILYDDILFASDTFLHSIFQINLTDPNFSFSALQLDSQSIDNPVALAYDPMMAQVYWTDVVQKTIRRAFIFNGTQEVLFTNQHVETPDGLTIDPTSRLLFWTDVGLPSIQVSHLDGRNRKSIVLTDIEKPRAIIADPENGLLYWSDWGVVPKIERAYMDGTNRTILVNTGLSWPNGLALDYKSNKLYWCDAQLDRIEFFNLNTMERTVLLDLGPEAHPFSIALHGSYIYWSDWMQKTLMRADKNTGANNGSVGAASFARLNGLYSYSTRDHAPFSNSCISGLENGGCSTLCLPTPVGRVCACQDGSQLERDGVSCTGVIQCPAVLVHGNIQEDCLPVPGSTCEVVCQQGYQASLSRIRCGPGGIWNVATDSVCELVRCPSLLTPANASVVACLGPHVYGNQCRFRCQTGYRQVDGADEVSCMDDGQWSYTLLTCHVITCPPLPALPAGVHSPAECSTTPSPYNTTCSVLCPRGYRLRGVASRMCQADAQWTDLDRMSSCIDVTRPDFGDSCPSDISVTAGHGQISANVTWTRPQAEDNSGEEPSIISLIAEPPLLLGEGSRMVMYYAHDAEGNMGVCTFIVTVVVQYCDMLGIPINGYFEHCTHHFGSVCAVRCNHGFAVRGSAQRSCERSETGQMVWSGNPAHCPLIECPESETSSNVFKAECSPPYYFRAECSYTCAPGYERKRGSEHRICQDNNQWSGSALECQKKQCSPLVLSDHAIVSPVACQMAENFYDDVCVLSCNEGYQLVGNASHRCLATGEWSAADDAHFCQDIAAPHFNGTCPEDFSIVAPRGKMEAVVTWTQPVVMDNDGNELNVTSSRQSGVTLPEGLHAILIHATDRTGNQGTCRFVVTVHVVHCPLHSFPHFGDFHGERCDNYYGVQCTFTCMLGYQLTGSNVRTCEWSGQENETAVWTGERPVCEVVMCPMFDFSDNILVGGCDAKAGALSYGSRCLTLCDIGMRPVAGSSDGMRVCRDTGSWSGENIQCEDVYCPALRTPMFGMVHCETQPSQYLSTCRYECSPGFSFRGSSVTTCLASGNWSTTDVPTCQDISAPEFLSPCPQIILTFQPDPCENGSIVTYERPTAEDNSQVVNVTGSEDDVVGTWWPVGIYERAFTARDPSGNTAECLLIINVLRIECQQLPLISLGSVVSQSCGNRWGSSAEFECDDGTQLIGSQHLTCGADGQWNGTIPSCTAVFCSPLVAPAFGSLSPPQCTSEAVHYMTRCMVVCDPGFVLMQMWSALCQRNGQWSRDASDFVCMDYVQPQLECPEPQYHILPPGQATVNVFVTRPTATDNSGINPNVTGYTSGSIDLEPGMHIFSFSATDEAGNSAHCLTEITVKDAEAPTVVTCPNATTIQTSNLPVYPQWEEPVFDDNIGIHNVHKDKSSGKPVYQWGSFVITYTVSDMAGNTNSCRIVFDIVDETTCQPLQPPPNGALACENTDFCTVHCNDGYVFLDSNRPQDTYVCLSSGQWNFALTSQQTIPYLPACTKRESNVRIRWERRDKFVFGLHHLSGSCENQREEIQNAFVMLFMGSNYQYCQTDPDNNCKMENIVVNCGDTTEERRRRREVESTVNVNISMTLVIERNDTVNIDSVLRILNTSAGDIFGQMNTTLDLAGGGTGVFDEGQSETGSVNVICATGMVVSGMLCVNCPKGTRYKLTIGQCVPCGIATYQDEEGQLTCKICPTGKTTTGRGAFNSTHCQMMCPPGQISYQGVSPCQLCPIGSYQSRVGQHGCEPCPDGMTTRVMGATTVSQCSASGGGGVQPTTPTPNTDHHVTGTTATPPVQQSTASSQDKTDIATVIPTTRPIQTGLSATTGKVDIGVITKNPNKGRGDGDNDTRPQPSPLTANWTVIAVVIACAGFGLLLMIIGVCFVVKRRRNRPNNEVFRKPRPISWTGSTRAMLTSEEIQEEIDGMDLLAISNPVFGMDSEACISPLGTSNFTTFLDDNAPSLFGDPSDIPKLDPPPKKVK